MIEITRYPRLGAHGWKAVVTVAGNVRECLKVGTRADMVHAAQQIEAEMAKAPRRAVDPENARVRQAAVRRTLQFGGAR